MGTSCKSSTGVMSVLKELQGESAVRKWNSEEKSALAVEIREGLMEEVVSELDPKDKQDLGTLS